ncbi:hypothetical protein LZ32DRAFT_208212 [Colletotrichum eremochloae]|nr:hypothetical protein LZ32DRAFT_208212 [Colletotrichum eremochloae]
MCLYSLETLSCSRRTEKLAASVQALQTVKHLALSIVNESLHHYSDVLFSTNGYHVGPLEQSRTDMRMTEEISCISPRAVASRPAALVALGGLTTLEAYAKAKKKASSPFPILNARKPNSFTYFLLYAFVSLVASSGRVGRKASTPKPHPVSHHQQAEGERVG